MRTFMIETESKEMIGNYLHLVPKEFRKYCSDNNAVIIGSVETEPDGLVATGLIIITANENEMIIRWLFVDPAYRGRGAGEELLRNAFQIARLNNIERLTIHVPSLGEKFIYESPMAGFFSDFYFDYIDTISIDGLKVFILSAPNNGDELADIKAQKDIEAKAALDKAYAEFPDKFSVTGTEYYGVPEDENQ